jgi:hypothetical protein
MDKWKKILGVDLDDNLRKAIERAVLDSGNAAEFARKLGVSTALPRQWIGKNMTRPIKTIPESTYVRLYPHIREYLPPGDARYLPRDTQSAAAIGFDSRRLHHF